MDNLVAHHRGLREEAEKKLSMSLNDLEEAKGQLQKASQGLQVVTAELRMASSSLQHVSDELSIERRSSDELKARLAEMEANVTGVELELELAQGREVELKGQLAGMSKDVILAEYKASQEFEMDWLDKVLPYYDQGKFHVIRLATASRASPFQLFKWGKAAHFSEEAWNFHNLVPYSQEELNVSKQREPQWSPPTPVPQNIPYLLEVSRDSGHVKMTTDGWLVEPAAILDEESQEEDGEAAAVGENDPLTGDV